MAFCIEKFASALCFIHSIEENSDDEHDEYYELTGNTEPVLSVIHRLGKMFERHMTALISKIENALETELSEEEDYFESFMKINLSKYVEISERPTFFKFLLVCSLASNTVYEMFRIAPCYTIIKVISLCLIATYNRCYKDLFEKDGACETLDSYCRKREIYVLEEDEEFPSMIDRFLHTITELKKLQNTDYKNFILTDGEKEMLEDMLDLAPPEGSFQCELEFFSGQCSHCSLLNLTNEERNSANEVQIKNDTQATMENGNDKVNVTNEERNATNEVGSENDTQAAMEIGNDKVNVTNELEVENQTEAAMEIGNDCEEETVLDLKDEEDKEIEICTQCDGKCYKHFLAFQALIGVAENKN